MVRRTILFYSEVSNPAWPDALRKAFPEFAIRTKPDDLDPKEVVAAIVWKYPAGMLRPFRNLRLIQVLGAGVDHLWSDSCLPRDVPIARLVDPGLTTRMTEYVLLHSLALHRGVPEMRHAQGNRTWQYLHPRAPEETCVGVLGLGVLGRSCAGALANIGFTVVGWSRSPKSDFPHPTFSGSEGLAELKRCADILVLLLPLTPNTLDFVDETFLADIRQSAALINVGRGKLIVDDALVAALDVGRVRHAVLDVFRVEPLPPDHPFWTHPKITVTPHNSSATNPSTAIDQIVENVRRAISGQTPRHLVDPTIGY